MFDFSFAEMIVVLIIAVLVIKPQDLPLIAKKFKEIKLYFVKLKTEVENNFNLLTEESNSQNSIQNSDDNTKEDIDEINFYLTKIVELGSTYTGSYSLQEIREHYKVVQKSNLQTLVKDKKKVKE